MLPQPGLALGNAGFPALLLSPAFGYMSPEQRSGEQATPVQIRLLCRVAEMPLPGSVGYEPQMPLWLVFSTPDPLCREPVGGLKSRLTLGGDTGLGSSWWPGCAHLQRGAGQALASCVYHRRPGEWYPRLWLDPPSSPAPPAGECWDVSFEVGPLCDL